MTLCPYVDQAYIRHQQQKSKTSLKLDKVRIRITFVGWEAFVLNRVGQSYGHGRPKCEKDRRTAGNNVSMCGNKAYLITVHH